MWRVICICTTMALASCSIVRPRADAPTAPIHLTHGVASGDVTDHSAIVWARADGPARLHVEYAEHDANTDRRGVRSARGSKARATTDLTAQARLEDLAPATRYRYRVWFGDAAGGEAVGTFTTAARADDDDASVKFVFGGDLGGQELCRRPDVGYDIFAAMLRVQPDFFVANGDMIYADGECPHIPWWHEQLPQGSPLRGWRNVEGGLGHVQRADVDWNRYDATFPIFTAHWRYNRQDEHHLRFLERVPMYGQWDDHEVINDFGAAWSHWNADNRDRTGYSELVRAGRAAFFAYTPIDRNRDEPDRIYRSFRHGRHLELFLVDARSYRSRNDAADTAEAAKTMLGAAQLDWLVDRLAASEATWKVVSVDVTMAIPTGSRADVFGRDGWASGARLPATGFERELAVLLARLDAADVENLVFIATDVHRAASIAYDLDADGDGDKLELHELVTGPLNAGAAPAVTQDLLDPTFGPRLLYSEGEMFNFGVVRIGRDDDGVVRLRAEVRDRDGRVRPGSSLVLEPAPTPKRR